nr:auxilin-like protein [Tanacetum cinerariifolium]
MFWFLDGLEGNIGWVGGKHWMVGGKHACVDLTGVSHLVRLSGRVFTVVRAALKAVSCKVTKHEKTCIENQHVFILFAFDTFGFLAPETVKLVNRVQRVMKSHVITPRFTNTTQHKAGHARKQSRANRHPHLELFPLPMSFIDSYRNAKVDKELCSLEFE